MPERRVEVEYMARVEGETSLTVDIDDGKVTDVKLSIFEPPRFFEAFLQGRECTEAPDITARICGICPVAYQMSSIHAMEQILDIQITAEIRELRRLLYCGEWIESHVLHAFMLHAPDFLGYPSAIEMAADHRELVELVLRVKKTGNELVTAVGGREIHPVNVRVGGFYSAPPTEKLQALLPALQQGADEMRAALDVLATLEIPQFEREYQFVSLYHPDEYPMNEGRIISNRGLNIGVNEFQDHFEEIHEEHSNALHGRMRDGSIYKVGPLARFNNAFDVLPDSVKQLAARFGVEPPVLNPFKSIIVRVIETVYALEEAIRIIKAYRRPSISYVEAEIKAGVGHAITEAPRGILYHRYEVDDAGLIVKATITPPTSQNQPQIEDDLRMMVPGMLDLNDDELDRRCEQAVRNYDPCISCATHFLDVTINQK